MKQCKDCDDWEIFDLDVEQKFRDCEWGECTAPRRYRGNMLDTFRTEGIWVCEFAEG